MNTRNQEKLEPTTKQHHLLNKCGSYIIFLTIIFSSIILFTSAVINASGKEAIDGIVNEFGVVWGKSILSEYDLELKDRYGIFAFSGNKIGIESKLDYYSSYTTKDKEYIKDEGSSVNLEPYILTNPNNLILEIKECLLFQTKPKVTETEERDDENRYIDAKWVINSLPSNNPQYNLEKNLIVTVSLYDYLFVYFKDYLNERDLGKTYFNNEIEYVITGQLNDKQAKNNVYYQILAIRNGINLSYLYTSSDKRDLAFAIAEIIAPEFPIVVQFALLESWAYIESVNDMKILYDGKKVPAFRNDENWNTSIYEALSGTSGKPYIGRESESGLDYQAYLLILLAKTNDEKKLLRMMDLIQINMKYIYSDSFLLSDYYIGLDYTLNINEKEYEFSQTYIEQER